MLNVSLNRMETIARLVHNYAPRLDEETKVKFAMFIHNRYAYTSDLSDLNLRNEWSAYSC